MAKRMDGRSLAKEIRAELAEKTRLLKEEKKIVPGLAVILVGDNPASKVYVRNKRLACKEVGFFSRVITLPADTKQEELSALVLSLNNDPKIHGILVQSPLPEGLDERAIIEEIDPHKDVDGFHAVNVGKTQIGLPSFAGCTPLGVVRLLNAYNVDMCGKHAVVVGRSNIVGKPMAMLLLAKDATVTICHSKTLDLGAITRQADILVSAVGKRGIIKGDMLKPGVVVVDVAMNQDEKGRLCGDVVFDEAEQVASLITPVPGGVGPMTIAMLLENTFYAAENA
ncbi:MAG: bifunctional methylenetetrahydrofolate dehydrogenase/methenyltetrahydrofolate cyclohydrolase FolD [Christensenellales bacterium]|jgi:methylenetetrahydrofolate dehydrogenase (NADP+)/methenyltetrahydrofolate cyclohydrolase